MPAPSFCPKAYEEPQTGQRHEPLICRTCVRGLSQCWGAHVTVRPFLLSCLLNIGRQPKEQEGSEGSFRLTHHLGHSAQFSGWHFSHASCRPPTSNFSASGAAAGAKCWLPTRPLEQLQHTTRGKITTTRYSRSPVTAHPPHVHVPLPRHTFSCGRTACPGAGNQCADRLEWQRQRAWLGTLLHLDASGGRECRGEDERKEASVLPLRSALMWGARYCSRRNKNKSDMLGGSLWLARLAQVPWGPRQASGEHGHGSLSTPAERRI